MSKWDVKESFITAVVLLICCRNITQIRPQIKTQNGETKLGSQSPKCFSHKIDSSKQTNKQKMVKKKIFCHLRSYYKS